MIRPINHDPVFLAQPATPATRADEPVVADLVQTLLAHKETCVGMAANMIGVAKQIIVVLAGPIPLVLINPKITHASGAFTTKEGCLSLEGQRETKRFRSITVKFLDANFAPRTQQFNDFIAQIIQHECDHCAGKLI